jgi:hypothetical protein
MIDSYLWVNLDKDEDGTVTIGDIFLTAKYCIVEFPVKTTRNLFRRMSARVDEVESSSSVGD